MIKIVIPQNIKYLNIVLMGLTLAIACKETKATDSPVSKVESIEKVHETETIIQKILDLPKLQWMFHPEVADRLPIKLVANEFVSDSLKLWKFERKVQIAALSFFEKEKIQDCLIFDELNINTDTAYFVLKYEIEGASAKGKLVKVSDTWTVQDYSVLENSVDQPQTDRLQSTVKDSIRTLAYKDADLSYLSNVYYGDGHYKHVLKAYNGFTDNRSVDKKHDSIKIPELSFLARDSSLPELNTISKGLGQVIEVRNLYLMQGRTLWELPKDTVDRDFRPVPQNQKLELLGAAKLMHEAIANMEQHENPPKKAIGQFRQVANYLEKIAQGEIDENGYILDLVNQRLAYGLSNCIKWAKE